jgi:AcrR family transcriptional regulator
MATRITKRKTAPREDSAKARRRVSPPETTSTSTPLKQACIAAAREVIAEIGVANLSLRDVARKLNVSHQAPYKHYPTREHLLAEVLRQCFADFTDYLNQRDRHDDAMLSLRALGNRYLDYAANHPLEYRLMFHTPWPEPAVHQEMMRHATMAYETLRDALMNIRGAAQHNRVSRDALCIWSAMHGLASIALMEASQDLTGIRGYGETIRNHMFDMLAAGLQAKST